MDILNAVLAYSCALPAVTGIIFYKRMDISFHPFIWAMWLSVISETSIRFVFDYSIHPFFNIYTRHFYSILNYLFFLLFFYRQNIISFSLLKILLVLGAVIFIINSLFKSPNNYLLGETYTIFYLIIFYLAVQLLTKQIFNHSILISKNALFFIACSLLLYAFPILQNSIRIFVRYYYSLDSPKISVLQRIFEIANALSYILFFVGALFIPKKQNLNFISNEL